MKLKLYLSNAPNYFGFFGKTLKHKQSSPSACFCRDELGRVVLGDVITGIDGRQIKLQRELFEILDEKRPGDTIKVEVLRGTDRTVLDVTLGGRDVVGSE